MEKVMAIKNLKKIYGVHGANPKVAINDISLQIDQGDFVCIMGPSGSGKTTLVNILSTIDEATSGKVILLGQDISNLSEKDKASLRKSEIGFIFQNYNLIETLKNKDNILFSLRLNNVSLDKQQQALIKISKKLGIEDIIDKFPFECSGGQQQRVAIARALITNPKILFADEPTGNLDSKTSDEVIGLLKLSVEKYGQTLVMITHDDEIAQIADRVLVIEDGKVAEM